MNRSKTVVVCLFIFLFACFSLEAWAGGLVWGPKKYTRDTGKPVPVVDTFTIEKPKGKFWLQISNGGHIKRPDIKRGAVEPVNQASSAYIKLNGVQVAGPEDLNQNVYGFTKDITLQANNTIEVEVRGIPGSYITVEIRKAELNETVSNKAVDLSGSNMKDLIHLTWGYTDGATEYAIYKAYSIAGPWIELGRVPLTNAVDGTPEAQTKDLCYMIEALDSNGKVIRRYEPICVPKWQIEESALPLTMGSLSDTDVELAIASSTQTSSASYNDMCLSDPDFTNASTMSYEDIRKFLKDKGSFLQGDEVKDVDGSIFDPAEFIDFAAQVYGINPQVILTTLQKEQQAITTSKRLSDSKLKRIMGYGSPSTITAQILDGTAQMRRDFDKLSNGQPTAGGWKNGVAKNSLDPLTVTPANKAVAILFSYTPWVWEGWGGRALIGGNALFCKVWKDFGFLKPQVQQQCWSDRYGYRWNLILSDSQVAGTVSVLYCGTWNVTGSMSGSNIHWHAVNPTYPYPYWCTWYFDYYGTLSTGGNYVSGNWNNYDGFSGTWWAVTTGCGGVFMQSIQPSVAPNEITPTTTGNTSGK